MKWQSLVAEAYRNMFDEIHKVLDGLTIEDLHKRPSPGANPIGWLCWHTIRSCDRMLGDIVLGEQLWISQGWHKKFNKPAEFNDTGVGYTDEQVDALIIPDVKTLLDYMMAVKTPLLNYIENLEESELDKEFPASWLPDARRAVSVRLSGTLLNLQHVGAAAYVRGIIKGHGWYGR
jgi:hypothetical protein